ncbi:transient receptor potential cation channel subfamily a member 1-like [Gigaspora margarita]|uniref:Transient receptor potential cation channel subfamily a member 1-like n=1 Tax=Gigaspora margarita TaxID=4874 RepID=A0A8H4AX46_GIGMA|nr:transient receptor potential cation channel subfamily a member 1-like [Gigaspora margarita]
MASNSDNPSVGISIEKDPDENKNQKIVEIVCSPKLEHVAALHENNKISLWSIVSQESQEKSLINVKTVHFDNIRRNEKIEAISDDKYELIRKIFAISDNKQVSISLDRIGPYNFKIFEFETEKEIKLTFPDWQKEIDFLSFIDNGNIIMINAKYYRAYVFSIKRKKYVCNSMIELQYFKKIYITPKGKLILFNDTIHEITLWDIEDLSAKSRIFIEWCHILIHIELSDDEELLAVLTENKKFNDKNLYVFSTETGINLSSFPTKLKIDRFHLIASSKGERLLYRYDHSSGKKYCLMDSYNLKTPTSANKLFENKQIQEQYIIKSDIIIYTNNRNVLIEKLVPDNWIEYLRKDLKDTNSITTPSEMTIYHIINIINEKSYDPPYNNNNEFEGKFLKWSLELNDKSVKLIVNKLKTSIKKQLDILPSLKGIDENNYIFHCEVLENDDFVTITHIGIFIWTNKLKGIKMHYYWNDCDDSLENFVFEKEKLKKLSEKWTSRRILPASSYETILKNLHLKFGENELFHEFLLSNIEDEFYLTCYGKDLMKTLIEQKDDKWIRNLGTGCINKCLQENTIHLISKIPLLSIIFENFDELSEDHPAFMASALSLIGFVIPSAFVNPTSTSSHLSKYGRYYHLYKTSFIDLLISILRDRWIIFQESFQIFKEKHPFFNSIVKRVIEFYNVSHSTTVLAIPLPNFVSYPKEYKPWKELLLPKPNPFTHSNKVEVINEEFYRYLNGEALLKFKWNTYGRKYYLLIWAIYTIFLCSFVIAASFYKNISQTILSILLYTTICLGIWHLFFELRQFIFSPLDYLASAWNFFDLGAFLLPMISSILWLQNNDMPTEWATFSTLLLEIKFLLFFRAIEFSGDYFSMILGVAQRGFSFLIILGFIIVAFAHSLHLLLRPTVDVSLDYPSYSDDPNDPWNLATTFNAIDPNGTIEDSSSFIEPPTATTNMFMLMGSAIAAVYIMLTGDTTPISYWDLDSNLALLSLTILFTFVATIYLMNLFIGVLSNEIGETKTREQYLILRAEVLEEIELFYMLPYQRRKENWFPFLIFYECHIVDLREHTLYTQKDKWTGYKKPYISKALHEVLHLPEEPPSLKKIEEAIKGQPDIKQIQEGVIKVIKNEIVDEIKKVIQKEIQDETKKIIESIKQSENK